MFAMTRMCVFVALILTTMVIHKKSVHACTVACLRGEATFDGKPMLWYNHMNSEGPSYLVKHTDGAYHVIGTKRNASSWPGSIAMNSEGLAFANNTSSGYLKDGDGNEGLGYANLIKTHATIASFHSILGDYDAYHNIPWIDNTGEATMYELGDCAYWEYNTENSTRQSVHPEFSNPRLFAFRWNGAFKNDNHCEPTSNWPSS